MNPEGSSIQIWQEDRTHHGLCRHFCFPTMYSPSMERSYLLLSLVFREYCCNSHRGGRFFVCNMKEMQGWMNLKLKDIGDIRCANFTSLKFAVLLVLIPPLNPRIGQDEAETRDPRPCISSSSNLSGTCTSTFLELPRSTTIGDTGAHHSFIKPSFVKNCIYEPARRVI